MKASGGPQKLRFTIQSVSGEDPDFPVRELLFHSPATRGWVSPRFCKYPQEIVLRLEAPSKIQQIQILSHEFKIATKVELYAGQPPGPAEDPLANMKRLGYLSFDANDRSNHQARELKSVHLSTPAFLIRLVIHRCWVNKLNIYNQVGIIALNLIGEPMTDVQEGPLGYLEHGAPTRDVTYYNQAAAEAADLNLDIHVDSVTAHKIRELVRAKDAAVASEDYDEAKRIKESIERLKVMGQKIAQLEARKRAAVEREDYDAAKLIKADMDKLRAAGEATAISTGGGPRSAEQAFNRVLASKPPSLGGAGTGAGGGSMSGGSRPPSASPALGEARPVPFDDQLLRPASGGGAGGFDGAEDLGSPSALHNEALGRYSGGGVHAESSGYHNGSKHQEYEDRPLKGKGMYDTPTGEEPMGGLSSKAKPPPKEAADPASAPAGWPSDLPGPEKLPGTSAKDAEALEELAGEYVARSLFSKNWQLRDAALAHLAAQVREGRLGGQREVFRTIVRVVQRGLNDKVANVFLGSLALFSVTLDTLGAAAGARELTSAADMVLPALLEKLGDTNARLRDASREAVMNLAGQGPEGGLRGSTSVLLKPAKSQTAWRPILGVLQILQDLVPILGISKTGDGFELGELMEYTNKAMGSANAEVRAQAVKVVREAFDLVGPPVRRFLAKDLSAKMKEQLDTALGVEGPSAPPPPAAAASRAAPAAKPPPRDAATLKAPPPHSAGRAGGSGGRGMGRGSTAALPPLPPPPPPPAAADDPAPYEAELKAREAKLGKTHPDIAETCGNLAILYNQQGDHAKALPLYERALRIYEKEHGPNHPEVAHTLTDLAVLHLEQGRDDIGRPLLERALRIQEQALGPDHPDVLAIKDVLNSE